MSLLQGSHCNMLKFTMVYVIGAGTVDYFFLLVHVDQTFGKQTVQKRKMS